MQLVDIRNPGEQEVGVMPGAVLIPLAQLLDHTTTSTRRPAVVYCAGGYRSSVAASLLRSLGFERVADINGGYDAWADGGLPNEYTEVSREHLPAVRNVTVRGRRPGGRRRAARRA